MQILSIKIKKRKRRSHREPRTYLSWLKQHVSEIDLGLEVADAKGSHPIHLNKNQDVLDHFGRLRQGERSWLQEKWDWEKLKHHGSGLTTLYFAGAPERRKPRTLFLIDVDCKRRGTPEEAQAYLSYLATDDCKREYGIFFPDLYTEPSTHGRGGHGFPLLDKGDFGPEFINNLLLHRLQPLLRRIPKEKGFNIELVEIKGTLPVIEWGDRQYEVREYTAGCLGKLPREGETRFDELRATAVIAAFDLLRLPVAAKTTQEKQSGEATGGSVSGRHVTCEMLAGLQDGGRYRVVAEELLGEESLRTSGRQAVTREDVTIMLMLGAWFTKNMLKNGALPEARWRGLWTALYESNDIDRAWCHKRFKAMRDWLSLLRLLKWESREYVVGWFDEGGHYHKGQAAKWRFGEELMQMLAESTIDHHAGGNNAQGRADDDGNNGEKGRHPLREQVPPKSFEPGLEQLMPIRPIKRMMGGDPGIDLEELSQVITPFASVSA
jgi:hypothetical protein